MATQLCAIVIMFVSMATVLVPLHHRLTHRVKGKLTGQHHLKT